MTSLFKVHSFQIQNRNGTLHFFEITSLKRSAIIEELMSRCINTHGAILDNSSQGQVLDFVQKLCES